jgi:hypothetical protein
LEDLKRAAINTARAIITKAPKNRATRIPTLPIPIQKRKEKKHKQKEQEENEKA